MRKILLLDHPQFTSATYFLWHGLREIEELYPNELMVTVWPYIPTHYDKKFFKLEDMPWWRWLDGMLPGWKVNPNSMPAGIPPFQPNEFLNSNDTREITRTELCPRLSHERNLMLDEDQVVRLLEAHHFDLIVLGNSHRVPTILLARLKARVKELPPIVYLDGGERDELNEHWVHVFHPNLIFKQILTPEVKARGLTHPIPGYNFKIYPLPLCSPIVEQNVEYFGFPIQWLRRFSTHKTFPVFYHMGATWPARQAVLQALDAWVDSAKCSIGRGGETAVYHLVLAMSKMGVSMRGSGRDTTRYWEIPLYKTALICDGTMGCIHPYPFEDRKTAFFYRSIDELLSIVNENQKDDRNMFEISERGQVHLQQYHSTAARAMFFLDILEKEIGFPDQGLHHAMNLWKRAHDWDGRPWEGPVV